LRYPVIGIPTYNASDGRPEQAVRVSYIRALMAVGGAPLPLPLLDDLDALRRVFDLAEGLLLAGGGDMAARFYGAPDSGKLSGLDEQRDEVEIILARWALQEGLPVFGICRGIQTLNVAAGGTLVQDIPSEIAAPLPHRTPTSLPGDHIAHEVEVLHGTRLAEALGVANHNEGRTRLAVNSRHHQAVLQVAPEFVVSAYAPDGVIEGIELAGAASYALGVQWHPENMIPHYENMTRLLADFVQTCAR